jgi:plasmid stabilization system protein ParE
MWGEGQMVREIEIVRILHKRMDAARHLAE